MKMYGRKKIYIYERMKRSIGKSNNSRRKATGDRGYKQQETARRDLCTHRVWSLIRDRLCVEPCMAPGVPDTTCGIAVEKRPFGGNAYRVTTLIGTRPTGSRVGNM
jgi:hypothetical protein